MSWLGETDDYNKEDSLGEFNNDRYIEVFKTKIIWT